MNPFLNKKIDVVEFTDNYQCSVMIPSRYESGKKLTTNMLIPNYYYADKDPKCSIYVTDEVIDKLTSLSGTAKNIFFYILKHLKSGKDVINLDYKKIMPLLNISANTYYGCIESLEKEGFITKKHTKDYWINPHYFFNGQRHKNLISLYTDAVINIAKSITPTSSMETVTEPALFYGYEADE
jgi:hypothetical protein